MSEWHGTATLIAIGGAGDKSGDRAMDEDTAIVVTGEESFRVLDSGGVYIADGAEVTFSNGCGQEPGQSLSIHDVRVHLLSKGDRFDLRTRRPVTLADAA